MQENEALPPGYHVAEPNLETWVDEILGEALSQDASDVTIRANESLDEVEVLIRVDGIMRPFRYFKHELGRQIINRVRTKAELKTGVMFAPEESTYPVQTPEGPLKSRLTSFRKADGGPVMVFRLPQTGPLRTLEEMNFLEHNLSNVNKLLDYTSGALIFAGPMGSGKTTAAHAAVQRQNNGKRAIWSIEDPVERVLPGINQLEVNERNDAGFDKLLPAIVRSDYDTLFLGEIRDKATASAGLRQAKAGRQVISTIHANDNITALLRLIELSGESPMSVLDSVRGIISQRLVGRLNPDFATEPHRRYKGRVPVHEVLILNKDVIQTFIDGRPLAEVRKAAYESSYSTLHENHRRGRGSTSPRPSPLRNAMTSPVHRLHQLIDRLGDSKIGDLHIHANKPVRIEKNKTLELIDEIFTPEEINELLGHCMSNRREPLKEKGHRSGSLDTGKYRARATFRMSTSGITASLRVIGETPDARALGTPQQILDLARMDSGLVIIYGPTGSGKTTLNAGMINLINHEFDKHIYMIEDPIEFIFTEAGSTSIIQREVGVHTKDYPTAIEDALRSKPHVILVGEILNPETAKSALHAATTGHLVFTTAHAGSVTEGVQSFIGQFPAIEQPLIRTRLSTSLLAVVVQRLLPSTDGRMVAAREVMVNNLNFADIIRNDSLQMIHPQLANQPGCNTLESDLAELLAQNKITLEVAQSASKNPNALDHEIRRRSHR